MAWSVENRDSLTWHGRQIKHRPVLQSTRLKMHLKTKGLFTGAQIPEFPGGISGSSGPWHSSRSMWKTHFSWLKGARLRPSDATISAAAAGPRSARGLRGRVSGSWGQEGSHRNDCCSSLCRIPFLSDGGSSTGDFFYYYHHLFVLRIRFWLCLFIRYFLSS